MFGNNDTSTPELPAPLDTPYTLEELKKYDGSDENQPIYVAIKGDIFDVSANRGSYGPGGSYHVFTGKDASYALGASSLKPEDCHGDISSFDEEQHGVLDKWYTFFSKRYPIVGRVKK